MARYISSPDGSITLHDDSSAVANRNNPLLNANPAQLTDAQLADRLALVRQLGRTDGLARMEFINRQAKENQL